MNASNFSTKRFENRRKMAVFVKTNPKLAAFLVVEHLVLFIWLFVSTFGFVNSFLIVLILAASVLAFIALRALYEVLAETFPKLPTE